MAQTNPGQAPELNKVNFKPKTEINEYLVDDFNVEIYEEYPIWKHLFQPLEFFNLLYEQNEIICANTDKKPELEYHIRQLNLSEDQFLYFLSKLLTLISPDHQSDAQLTLCHRFIKKQYDLLYEKLCGKYDYLPRSYVFMNVKKHLKTLKMNNEKIEFLINISTDFKQNKNILGPLDEIDFVENCELEIKKLEKLSAFTAPPKQIKKSDSKLSLRQIALLHCYEDKLITRDAAKSIASEHNYNSGDKLYQFFTFYNDRRHRIGIVEGSATETTLKSKIELLEGIIVLLNNNPKAKNRVVDELQLLMSKSD